jgi:HTH-like domain
VTTAGACRQAAAFLVRRELSARRACALLGLSRRWRGYESRRRDHGVAGRLPELLKELARRYPRFGYRRLHQMLLRQGMKINVKRVRRLCVRQGLVLPTRRKRKRCGIGIKPPVRAEYPNHVWVYDFGFISVNPTEVPAPRSLTDIQARDWYNNKVAETDAIEQQMRAEGRSSKEIFERTTQLRNDAKMQARDLMQNQELAKSLPPPKTPEEVLNKYGGDYEKAIAASKRTNPTVNQTIEDRRASGEE